MKALNLGCGNSYIDSPLWVNADWSPSGSSVIGLNLLKKLPFEDQQFDLVYTSHFIEHLLKDDFALLLEECYRVLTPRGTIRIVTPDWDEMVLEYVRQINEHNYYYAKYVQVEILDQCVRTKPGGELKGLNQRALVDPTFAEYLKHRSGYIANTSELQMLARDKSGKLSRLKNFAGKTLDQKIYALRRHLERAYVLFLVKLLPPWFRRYQVSMTDPGEKHIWLYTSRELHEVLNGIGFINTQKLQFDKTHSKFQEILSLDCLPEGGPRKGALSMFIEATKP